MQLVEPVLHVAEGAEQVEARLAQVEPGVKRVQVLLALVDARLLLGGGRKLRRRAWPVACAVAQFQLRLHALQLLVGNLLLQAGDLGLRIQFAEARGQFRNLNIVLLLCLSASTRARNASAGIPGFGVKAGVENREP